MENQSGSKAQKPSNSSHSKRDKFVSIAERRTVTAIRAVRVIGKLGNPFAYDYTEADVKKIAAALHKEVDDMRLRMMKKGSKASVEFKL